MASNVQEVIPDLDYMTETRKRILDAKKAMAKTGRAEPTAREVFDQCGWKYEDPHTDRRKKKGTSENDGDKNPGDAGEDV